jgi:Na+-transporting methylmalonyl-CoA/oxaloacetate decarboxylase gamma subunit
MTEALHQALTILLVGMTTVFFILSVVVIVGNLMVSFLNSSNFILNKKDTSHIPDESERAILKAAIQKWSKGKAKITGINKI